MVWAADLTFLCALFLGILFAGKLVDHLQEVVVGSAEELRDLEADRHLACGVE